MGRKLKTSAIAVSKEATAPQASIWINLNDCTDSKDDDKQEKREASPPPVNLIRVQETQDDATLPSPSIEKNKKEVKVKCDHCNKSVSSRCLKYYHRCTKNPKQVTNALHHHHRSAARCAPEQKRW